MKSPFPGMDPYIEACGLWGDFHSHLIEKIYDVVAEKAPEHYTVRTQERNYLVLAGIDEKEIHTFVPDVRVSSPPSMEPEGKEEPTTETVDVATEFAPLSMRAFIEETYRETFIEIFEAEEEQRLVTCIEVLSPSNKRKGSKGWKDYQRKRRGLFLEGVNLVEIDLLRGGERMPMLDPWPASPYTLLVARYQIVTRCQVWPAHFRRSLPTIPIPLRRPDSDIPLNLQPLIEGIYARSRYFRSINYSRPLSPSLNPEETAWVEQLLKAGKPSIQG